MYTYGTLEPAWYYHLLECSFAVYSSACGVVRLERLWVWLTWRPNALQFLIGPSGDAHWIVLQSPLGWQRQFDMRSAEVIDGGGCGEAEKKKERLLELC